MTYLDHNATSPVRPEVADAMATALRELPGNPSSVHAAGRRARDAVERARGRVASLLGAEREEIVFTSGGTEGDHLAIRALAALAAARGRRRLVSSRLEHPAVGGALEELARGGFEVEMVAVGEDGAVSLDALARAMGDDAGLVTLAAVNHELGNRYDVAALAAAAHARGALFHTDAVQAFGRIPVHACDWGVDAATVSAHKLGGPKGVGAVFIRRGLDLAPLFPGGHQERERRPGTENVAGIVGFGVACEAAAPALVGEASRVAGLRARLEAGLSKMEGVRLFGDRRPEARAPGTTMVAFAGAPGQLVAIGLDLEGICVSTGSACTSGALTPSPVLAGLGLPPERAAEGVRISLGYTTVAGDVERLLAALPPIVARVRAAAADEVPVPERAA